MQDDRRRKKSISAAVACAYHPEGWYDCGACPDNAKAYKHCPYPLKHPEHFEVDLSQECNCEAYGLDPIAFEALRLHRLLDNGAIGVEDMGLSMFEGAEFAGAEIARLTRLRMKRD